ncbi:MAG: DEAD/DEAH box helicase, partial [Shewanella sp.]
MSFSALSLNATLVNTLASLGYESPTPIQLDAIPAILAKQDVMAGAQTGTGKTAAFALPIL